MAKQIRPRAEYLATLPTLEVDTPEKSADAVSDWARPLGVNYRLELKLVTDQYRYWLCTQGATTGQPGGVANLVVGYVTMESIEPDEHGECSLYAYGPEDTAWFQGLDYAHMLREDVEQLKEELARDPGSWEKRKALGAAVAELETVWRFLAGEKQEPPSRG
jgi:hypothetical protein